MLLGLQLGSRESYESWLSLGRDLIARWIERPRADSHRRRAELWKAVRDLWPHADEQRRSVRALMNVTGKLPERHRKEVKASWWKTVHEAASPAEARRGLQAIITDYRQAYPSAMAVIERELDALVVHLPWPTGHANES